MYYFDFVRLFVLVFETAQADLELPVLIEDNVEFLILLSIPPSDDITDICHHILRFMWC